MTGGRSIYILMQIIFCNGLGTVPGLLKSPGSRFIPDSCEVFSTLSLNRGMFVMGRIKNILYWRASVLVVSVLIGKVSQ